MGLSDEVHYQNYHRVVNRDCWSLVNGARVLVGLVVRAFAPSGEVHLVLDDTVVRRRGPKIAALGVYRDAVRSSRTQVVKTTGLRWLCVMLLAPMPFALRRWALPVLTVLAPSERFSARQDRRHKKLTDWAAQALLQVKRWLPDRTIVCVADSSYAALEFLERVRTAVTVITRLRLDAALYKPAPARTAGTPGRPRRKGARMMSLERMLQDRRRRWQRIQLSHWYQQKDRPVMVLTGTAVWYHASMPVIPLRWVLVRDPKGQFEPQAFLSTDLSLTPQQILEHYVERWQVEVTYEETRQHLGLDTQRQWNDKAILRTTPVLFALYTIVALLAKSIAKGTAVFPVRTSAWYVKEQPTFSDALATVRQRLWKKILFSMSANATHTAKNLHALHKHLLGMLVYAT